MKNIQNRREENNERFLNVTHLINYEIKSFTGLKKINKTTVKSEDNVYIKTSNRYST